MAAHTSPAGGGQPRARRTAAKPTQVASRALTPVVGQPAPTLAAVEAATASPRQVAQGAFQLPVPAHTALHLPAEPVGRGSSRVALDGEPAQPARLVPGR